MKITIYDHGLNTEVGVALAKAGHPTGYFTPWDEAFPKSAKAFIGTGLEGIERVTDFEKAAERSDLLVFPDTFNGEKVDYWRRRGKKVWGAGYSERLEQDRVYMNSLQKQLGIPTPARKVVKGIEALDSHLKTVKDKWVKLSKYRGDKETFHHADYESTRAQFLGTMWSEFGANPDLEWIIEDSFDGVEVGNDDFFVDGEWLQPGIIGYEKKDEGYLCKIEPAPPFVQRIKDALRQTLRSYDCNSWVSFEIRGGKLIDPCIRCPHPPTATMLVIYKNIADIVTFKSTTLQPVAAYGAGIIVGSEWAENHWCEIKIEQKYRDFVKLQRACRVDGRYYSLPGSPTVCTCVGIGDTPEKAIKQAKTVVESISVTGASFNTSSLDELLSKTVPEGKKAGIPF